MLRLNDTVNKLPLSMTRGPKKKDHTNMRVILSVMLIYCNVDTLLALLILSHVLYLKCSATLGLGARSGK